MKQNKAEAQYQVMMLTQQLEEQQDELDHAEETLKSVMLEKEGMETSFLASKEKLTTEMKWYEEQITTLKEQVRLASVVTLYIV